ncbi:hypothetical protein AWENTII_009766 [Aspergillus wentii]
MYQPPTSHVAIIELETTRPSPEYTQIFLQPKDGDFLRLGNLNTGINYCGMAPCQDPLLFWYQGGHMKRNKRQYQGERKFSVSKLLVDCDAVIFFGWIQSAASRVLAVATTSRFGMISFELDC